MGLNRTRVRELVIEMLAAEHGCKPEYLVDGRVHLAARPPEAAENPARRRVDVSDPSLGIVTLGTGGVVSASDECLPWVEEIFGSADRDGLFEPSRLGRASFRLEQQGTRLWGPFPRYVCADEHLKSVSVPRGYSVEVAGPEGVDGVDPHLWPNALLGRGSETRPLMLAAIAEHGGEMVGLAAGTADSDAFWQIGIDIATGHQGKRVGAALTSAICGAILERGRVPYWGAGSANVPSMRTAMTTGMRPAWVEVFSKRLDDGSDVALNSRP